MRSEGVQQVAVAAWGLWLSSLVPRRSVLSRLDYYVSAQLLLLPLGTARARGGEGRGGRDVCPSYAACLLCPSASTTPVWLANRNHTDSGGEKDGHAAAGLRPMCASCCRPFRRRRLAASQAGIIHAHDSYPCAAQKDSHEASGTNRRQVPCARRPAPSPGHLDVRGRLPWS